MMSRFEEYSEQLSKPTLSRCKLGSAYARSHCCACPDGHFSRISYSLLGPWRWIAIAAAATTDSIAALLTMCSSSFCAVLSRLWACRFCWRDLLFSWKPSSWVSTCMGGIDSRRVHTGFVLSPSGLAVWLRPGLL